MNERPILFPGAMVRALLAGTKTQTRRVFKQATGLSLSVDIEDESGVAELSWLWGDGPGHDVNETIKKVSCPYGIPGDRLWVRETFNRTNPGGDTGIFFYRADNNPAYDGAIWKPSIFMPRWASRITLEITAVTVERLQDISYEDALAEGVPDCRCLLTTENNDNETPDETSRRLRWPQREYELLWNTINGPGAWDKNPWVWVIEFKRAEEKK